MGVVRHEIFSDYVLPFCRPAEPAVHRISGGSGAAESTIARHIAARHGLRVYATGDVTADHARRGLYRPTPESLARQKNHVYSPA
jgi:hypothetical protein